MLWSELFLRFSFFNILVNEYAANVVASSNAAVG
jgi:hypothetical protein